MEQLGAVVRRRDNVAIALSVANALETMRPLDVPAAPVPSNELAELLDRRGPGTVPDHLGAAFAAYNAALMARYEARGENERRLRTVLWAEQCLREAGRIEHATVRRFCRTIWGIEAPASACVAERWAQAQR